ncbi:MAG TPA: bacillithiol system redox-active protein YtxJ [Flavobacteriaceae bacterium]|nr:bacillithiol system redox-active protein YtxJ [Flavobacteriaceae bacterium]
MGIFDRFKSNHESTKQEKGGQTKAVISMPWAVLIRPDQINDLLNQSHEQTVLVFKHSTRCIISSMVLRALESNADQLSGLGNWYYLDLIANRACSNQVAQQLGVIHQSPQLIILKDGAVVWEASHQSISPETILAVLTSE